MVAMTKSGKYFLFLGIAQALHSIEEIYFHLYDFASKISLKVPPMVSFFAHLKMKSEIFAILNIIIIVIIFVSVPFYENKYRGALFVAWFWAIAEILNGLGHLTGAIIFSQYFPGALSAPLLLLSGSILLYQLYHDRY
jgi:hypothetical protein